MRARITRSVLPTATSSIERKLLSKLRKALEACKGTMENNTGPNKPTASGLVRRAGPEPTSPRATSSHTSHTSHTPQTSRTSRTTYV